MKNKVIASLGIITALSGSVVACGNTESVPVDNLTEIVTEVETSTEIESAEETQETTESETVVATEVEVVTNTETETPVVEMETPVEETPQAEYTVIDIDPVTKYATQSVNLRQGPSTDYEKIGALTTNEQVTVNGTCEFNGSTWYRLTNGNFVSAKYLSDTKVQTQKPSTGNNGGSNNGGNGSGQTQQPSGGDNSGGNSNADTEYPGIAPGWGNVQMDCRVETGDCTGAQ